MREVTWQPYPPSAPEEERQPCSYAGCESSAVLVQVQSRGAAATLAFGSLHTTTTPWCLEHAQMQGYEQPLPQAESGRHLNGLQRLIVRLLSTSDS